MTERAKMLAGVVSIGDRAVVGAMSVVTSDVPADAVAAGNPCRPRREVEAVS
jgi:maltose O-acetyltransferase